MKDDLISETKDDEIKYCKVFYCSAILNINRIELLSNQVSDYSNDSFGSR